MLPSETDCSGFEKTMNQYCAEVTKLTKILLHAISRSVVKAKGQPLVIMHFMGETFLDVSMES